MTRPNRLYLYAPFALVVGLAIACAVTWFIQADAVSRRIDALNGHAVMPGVRLNFATRHVAGFPFRIDLELTGARFDIDAPRGSIAWTAQNIVLHRLLYGADKEVFEAAGPQQVSWTDAAGAPKRIDFLPGTMRASAFQDKTGLLRADLDIIDAGSGPGQPRAGRLQFHIRKEPGADRIDVVLAADALVLPAAWRSALGADARTVRINAAIDHAGIFAPVRAGAMRWNAALDQWRARDGQLSITAADIDFGKTKLNARGSLGLDAARRLHGGLALSLTEAGALAAVAPGDTGLAAALALAANYTGGPLTAQLVFADGAARLGGIPVTPLDPVY